MILTKSNYYGLKSNQHYMSVSQFKSFLPAFGGCEAQAMATLNGEYEAPYTQAFMEGHYVHAWNEGTLDEFKANNPDLYSTRGTTAGQLKAGFKHCDKMIKVLENDEEVMRVLAGEKEVIMTAELFGIPWKIMIDSYQPIINGKPGIFADLKTAKKLDAKWWDAETQERKNLLERYGYLIQMAVYAEIEKRFTGWDEWLIPHMVIVTKEDPPDHEAIYFDYDVIETNLWFVKNHIERVKQVKSGKVEPIRCGKCEYCRLTKKIKRIKHYAELFSE